MKIGLLTTYSFNYGSYHQALALQKKFIDMGHECELINEKTKMFKWANLTFLYLFDPILPKFAKKWLGKIIPQYNSFVMIKNDLKDVVVSPAGIRSFSKLSKRYDCICIGSDELWSANADSIRFCPEYFGIGIDAPIFSYAPCAIKLTNENSDINAQIQKGLSKFLAISVRDTTSRNNINSIVPDLPITTVIDPTLLNPYFVPKNVPAPETDYVLLYGQHFNEDQKAYIKNYAKETGSKIYCIGWNIDWADKFLNVSSAKELQVAFASAKFCFPSTFHGTIFSILNHRQFISMLNPLRGKKVELLLNHLNLADRIYTKDIENIKDIDYAVVENRLSELRADSEDFLLQALGRVQNDKTEQHILI